MQISDVEITKLLGTKGVTLNKRKELEVEFAQITPDALPASAEPDPAEVARFTEIVKELPDEREELVMQLKERIEKGEYKVSGDEIADMMIRRMKADRVR